MNPSEIASELVVILWPQAGYPKIPKTIKRKAQSVIARVAWDRAIEKAKAELPRSTYDWPSKVARNAWRATIPQDAQVYSLSLLMQPYSFDAMTASLKGKAISAIYKRLDNNRLDSSPAESVYEAWIKWAKLPDSDYRSRKSDIELTLLRRRNPVRR